MSTLLPPIFLEASSILWMYAIVHTSGTILALGKLGLCDRLELQQAW
jgi:hypothetical protein